MRKALVVLLVALDLAAVAAGARAFVRMPRHRQNYRGYLDLANAYTALGRPDRAAEAGAEARRLRRRR